MLPVCVVIAPAAMFSGISGAALLTPHDPDRFPLVRRATFDHTGAIAAMLGLAYLLVSDKPEPAQAGVVARPRVIGACGANERKRVTHVG